MKKLLAVLMAVLPFPPALAADPGTYKKDVILWYDAFTQKDPTMLDRILAPTWVDIPSPPGEPAGPEAAKRTLARLTQTFPDLAIVVEDVIQEGTRSSCVRPSAAFRHATGA